LGILFAGVVALLWWLIHPVSLVSLTIGYSWLAFFYTCLLLTAISLKRGFLARTMRWKFLGALGAVSYCIYLIHGPLNEFAHEIILHGHAEIYNAKGVGVTLLAAALTWAIASFSWKYFEQPLIRRGHGYSYGN